MPTIVEGDSFHRYDRAEMKAKLAEAAAHGNQHFSHFGPETNLFEELEALFRGYAENGRGKLRRYLHDERRRRTVPTIAGHVHAVGERARGQPTCCSTKGCTAPW